MGRSKVEETLRTTFAVVYPIEIPDSLLELADRTRPDRLAVGDSDALQEVVARSSDLLARWVEDERYWDNLCRDDFAQTVGTVLPHVTNGEFGLAALIQSRIDMTDDPVLRARKALAPLPMSLSIGVAMVTEQGQLGMAGALVQVADDLFKTASGGLLMATNLITQSYPLAAHAAFLETGAKTILNGAKSLKRHLGPHV